MSEAEKEQQGNRANRRSVLALGLMSLGLALSYGLLAAEGLLFLVPKRLKPRVRWLFAGRLDRYEPGRVQSIYDLQGNEILVKRNAKGLEAFSSICPHLGCRVHWVEDKREFLCPCHNGVFNTEGVAISGPPADAGQSLARVPLKVDETTDVVYIGVRDVKKA
jgi:cytochrome b6-f complex iron-sulfur subunit